MGRHLPRQRRRGTRVGRLRGWTTSGHTRATDSVVRAYNPDGTQLQRLDRTARVDYRNRTVWSARNPANSPSAPGRTKIRITVGVDGDGFGNCTLTFVQPAGPTLVGHRGASTDEVPEGTEMAHRYAVEHGARVLEGDVRWTADDVMVIHHDYLLDRVTDCTDPIAEKTWAEVQECRTEVGDEPLWRLSDLLTYARSADRPLSLEVKEATLTDARADQFWDAVKDEPVRLTSFASNRPVMLKIKALDAADPARTLQYSSIVPGEPYPSVAQAKAVGGWLELGKLVEVAKVQEYQRAGLKVCLWTGYSTTDYSRMTAKGPDCVVVDDAAAYSSWLESR